MNVKAGEQATIPFTVDVLAQSYGRVNGQIHLVLTGASEKKTAYVLPFTFSITRPVSAATRNTLFFVLLLAGLIAPLLLLMFLSYRAAMFEHQPGLRAARLRVRVFADGTMRRIEETGAPPLTFVESDFEDAGIPPGRVRSFVWHDLMFHARWSWNPFAAPHGEVSVKGQYVTASDGSLRGRRHLTKGRVLLALPGTWIFALDPASEDDDADVRAVDGTVSVFIAAGAPFLQQAPRMMRSLREFFVQTHRTHRGAPRRQRIASTRGTELDAQLDRRVRRRAIR